MNPSGETHRPETIAHALEDLARRVASLRPCRRDPEAFHVERDEIRAELQRLASEASR